MSNGPSLPAMHILLADDNEANCLVARTILERAGHWVVTARNGDEALNLTKCAAFDLIILDILMPVMNGLSALYRIRQSDSENQNIPIFALTAYSDTEDRKRYSSAGFDAILSKPLRPRGLEEAFSGYKAQNESRMTGDSETHLSKCIPLLDEDKLLQLTLHEPACGLADIQSRFWKSIRGQCETIQSVLPGALEGDNQDLSEFRRAAHSIKGASASVGLAQISDISRQLRNAPPTEIPGLVNALLNALSEGRPALKQALSGTG